jgi:hypothetical protein
MQNYKQEVIKVVMMNFLDNILPKNCSENNYIKPLDPTYLVELNIDENLYGSHCNNFFLSVRKLSFKELIELAPKFKKNTVCLKDILIIENGSLKRNPSEIIMNCTTYLNLFPLTCEALIEKSQNELNISLMNAALNTMNEWNRSQVTIYSSIYNNFENPVFIYNINEKFNIFKYEDYYYLQPTANDYYSIRLILGKVFLIPNNYMLKIIRFSNKMFLIRYVFRLLLKLKNKKLNHKKTIQNMHFSNLLTIYINKIVRLLEKLLLINCLHFLGLVTPKSYSSFDDAINAAKL